MGLNDKNIGTCSNKVRREAKILDYICKQIDSNNEIKRYLAYQTDSPLSSKAKDKAGTIITQTDVTQTLIDKNIFNNMFLDDMINNKDNLIFVYSTNSIFDDITGAMNINIDVLCDYEYLNLKYSYMKRNLEIATRILDIFDNATLDGDIAKEVGNLTFKPIRRYSYRLSKTNSYVVYSIEFKIDFLSRRY